MASTAGSFVAEVLSSAGHMEREEINEKLSRLGKRMEEVKLEIQGATSSTFSEFESNFDITVSLSDKVCTVTQEMEELQHKVETEVKGQLKVSTGEFQSLRQQQEQLSMLMEGLRKLTVAKQLMDTIMAASSQQRYVQAACALTKLEKVVIEPTCDSDDEIKILVALTNNQAMLRDKLMCSLNQAWDRTVSLTSVDTSDRPMAGSQGKVVDTGRDKDTGPGDDQHMKHWQLTLPQSGSTQEQEALKEMVNALAQLGKLDTKVQSLGRQLLKYIFPLTLCWQKVVITETPLTSGTQILIRAESERRLPHCVDVFCVLGTLLDLLHDCLLHVTFTRHGEDGQDYSLSLMNLLGEVIGEQILDGIVKKCLTQAIPSSQKELESFHEVITITKTFQDRLVAIGFIEEGSRTLLDFVDNVNVLFANKKCQTILERARSLMTSDIHNTVLISADASPGELAPLDKSGGPSRGKSRKMEMSGEPLLNDSMFHMPTCRVSMCIQELLDLVYSTLNEASSSSPQCSVQLFYAVRNIFELFTSVFPTYHAHSLANFPQLSAVHHNNCMFLAHHLLTMGHQFKTTMPSDVSRSFVDLIPEIRRLGALNFMEQMNIQKVILEQYIEGAAGFCSVDEKSNYEQAERSVKQALHQLTHLQKVWQDVLPVSNYRKAIGILVKSLMAQVMEQVIALEDISSEAARKLFLLLKMVDERALTLLQTEEQDSSNNDNTSDSSNKARVDLHRHVPRYAKFTELQLLLNGSMQEISDRWADGMGPLAAEFPASEVKQLIRALFQNTDRRAAVLAKIK